MRTVIALLVSVSALHIAVPAAAQPRTVAGVCDDLLLDPRLREFLALFEIQPEPDPDGDPVLPSCASPLAERIFDATAGLVREHGTHAPGLYATGRNAASPAPLLEGPAIFGEIARMIEGAEHEVAIETFVWEPGSEPANTLLSAIRRLEARKRAEGGSPVTVRFLVDVFDNPVKSFPGVIPALQESIDALGLDPSFVHVEIAGYTHFGLGNLHSKVVTVDGRTSVVSGANVEFVHGGEQPWFDAGFRVDGDVAWGLRSEFADAWRDAKTWHCGSGRVDLTDDATRRRCIRRAEPLPGMSAPALDPFTSMACVPMFITGRTKDANPFGNRDDNTQDRAFLAAFGAAEEVIRVQTPNLNDDKAKRALLAAARRGVKVELILSRRFNERAVSLPGQGGGNEKNVRELYRRLAEAGVADPCSVLEVRWFSRDGLNPVDGNGAGASHAKYASIDGQVVIVGSANQDTQAWNHSRETNVLVDDASTTTAWDGALFEPNWARGIPAAPCGD